MKPLAKITLILFAVLAVFASPSFAQQNYLGQTTLAAAVAGQYLGPGSTGNVPAPTVIQVASATGIVAANPYLGPTPGQPSFQSELYVDHEAMLVVGITGTTLTVVRGVNGTVATPHSSGAMVLFGQPRFFYVQDPGSSAGNGPGSSPISNVPCVLANVVVSPWVNIRTGAQWYCNANSLVWTPGYNNPMIQTGASNATVASASALNIGGPVFKVSGTTSVTSFTFTGNQNIGVAGAATANSQTAEFCEIPTGIVPFTAGNNIGASVTSVVGEEVCWVWNGPDAKWYPIF